ncbi:SLAP domain-containing protein [Fictibacillus nanhaiensis]|uniref:SLAP domain-containing protein n=1 Tax=Fictibacillus nanhaiensis TaxID=742169 RepID=UPI001C93D9A5|nr:SLAP domain-containing protein [Fictibacillus nanhaiensis]MBY6037436.1 SLAP domain-containing protein [Fictibacillus nanhaiensis]
MQKLVFEPAWDRTLAQRDRLNIEQIFSDIHHEQKEGQQAVLVKTAFNHKDEFLVTVLLNNYSKEAFSLLGKRVVYKEEEQIVADFMSVYTLEIPAETSMPWTFIFPAHSLRQSPTDRAGELTIS